MEKRFTRDLNFSETVFVLIVLFFVVAAALFVLGADPAEAKEVEIRVQWDPDVTEVDEATGLPIHIPWETLAFYYRLEGGAYNYETPVFELMQTYTTEGVSEPTTTPVTITVPDDEKSTAFLVVRSRATQAGDMVESVDSDEASIEIDLTPLTAFAFAGAYNEVTSSVDLSWPAGDPRVKSWAVFVGDASGGPWTELTRVDAGTETTSISVDAATMFPPGKRTTKWFTMVAFGAYDVFSPNAAEISITRDRTTPAGVVNLKIFLIE